jgi:hypothetical protein
MPDSAMLKIDRAKKHARDLHELFRKNRPFSYILETNIKTGQRSTGAKRNEAVVEAASLIIGDIVHNLRSAIDHIYWEIVSPFANGPSELRRVQFPSSETEAKVCESIKHRLGDRAGERFFSAVKTLKPHGEAGGNELLYLLHELDIHDKHKLLIPTGDYTQLSDGIIRAQVPDFPVRSGNVIFGGNYRDVVWQGPRMNRHDRRAAHVSGDTLEQELNIPVDIVFSVTPPRNLRPVVPTLEALVTVAEEAVKTMGDARP